MIFLSLPLKNLSQNCCQTWNILPFLEAILLQVLSFWEWISYPSFVSCLPYWVLHSWAPLLVPPFWHLHLRPRGLGAGHLWVIRPSLLQVQPLQAYFRSWVDFASNLSLVLPSPCASLWFYFPLGLYWHYCWLHLMERRHLPRFLSIFYFSEAFWLFHQRPPSVTLFQQSLAFLAS